MLPLNKTQIPNLLTQAREREVAKDLDAARRGYEQVLKIDRDHVQAQFQLAQVFLKQKKARNAITLLDRALVLRPQEPAIWKLYGQVIADIGDRAIAGRFLDRAKLARLDRNLLISLQNMMQQPSRRTKTSIGNASATEVKKAIGLLKNNQPAEAAKIAERLRASNPDVAIVADILANAQAMLGDTESAEKNYRAATILDPNYAESHSNFGRFLVELRRYDEGIIFLKQALKLAPGFAEAMVHLGVALARSNKNTSAIKVFRKALANDPDHREANFEIGRVLTADLEYKEALIHLERARKLGMDDPRVFIAIARATSRLGEDREALNVLHDALANDENNPDLISEQGLIYQTLGEFDKANAAFLKAISLAPKNGSHYRTFLTSNKLAIDDQIVRNMEQYFEDPELSDLSRMNFGFGLAKAMEDNKQFDRVFYYLKPANDLVRKDFPFDIETLFSQTRALNESLSKVDFDGLDISGRSDYAPIFVTGLPRSGTTLVEQIVASHSAVTGGGELGFIRRNWGEFLIEGDESIRPWNSISKNQIAEIGRTAERQMRAQFPDAVRLTDKGVQSYSMIGPIRASLPNARFVVVKRDPRDTLLSMYKNLFAAGKHLHSYDLRDLARYYRLFEEIMEFWREKTPDWFHEIQYEDLIADPEGEARKLIAACDLEWEDQCLNFYENKRRVDTLSVHQVRQPMYSSSIGAWQRYESDLTEMLEELGGEFARSNSG